MSKPLPTWGFVQEQVRDDVRTRVLGAYGEHEDGKLTRAQLVARLVAVLKVTSSQAATLADQFTALEMEEIDGKRRQPTGNFDALLDDDDALLVDELQASWSKPDPAEALAVAGTAITLLALQSSRESALKDQGAEYWTRGVETDACELCQDLSTGIMPMSTPMFHHRGCGCSQDPIIPGKEY